MKTLRFAVLACAALLMSAHAVSAADVQVFKTSKGEVKITPIYHAAMLIQAGGKNIYVDPAKPADITGMPKADLILITDIHGDHMDRHEVTELSKTARKSSRRRPWSRPITTAKPISQWRDQGVGRLEDRSGPHVQHQARSQRRASCIMTRAAATATSSPTAASASTSPGTPKAFRKWRAQEHRCRVRVHEPALHHDSGRSGRGGEGVPSQGGDSVPLQACQDLSVFKKDLEGTGIDVRLLDWYPKAGVVLNLRYAPRNAITDTTSAPQNAGSNSPAF